MKLDLLYEIDVPKPWAKPHPYGQREAEQRAYREALEQIKLALDVDPDARAVRKEREDLVEGVHTSQYALISKAKFESEGTSTYPDATFTLRLSYGSVKGYHVDGKAIPAYTTMGGAFTHAAAHGNKPPYELPPSWIKARDGGKMKLDTPLDSKSGLQERAVFLFIGAFKPCWIREAPVGGNGRAGESRGQIAGIVTDRDNEIEVNVRKRVPRLAAGTSGVNFENVAQYFQNKRVDFA